MVRALLGDRRRRRAGSSCFRLADHDVSGTSPDPSTWIYRCDVTWAKSGSDDQDRPEPPVWSTFDSTAPIRR